MVISRFPECNVTYAENQKEYLPLPGYKESDGKFTCCWHMTLRERISSI